MIYNRTYIDIINAKKIFTNKIQNFLELTDEEQTIIDKAFFNLTAINRITAKINEIWGKFSEYGIEKVESEDVREWKEQEIFAANNFANIRKNIYDIIIKLSNLEYIDYNYYEKEYNKLTNDYIYTNINNLEKLLFDIDNIFDRFSFERGSVVYIVGAYNVVEQSGGLIIE